MPADNLPVAQSPQTSSVSDSTNNKELITDAQTLKIALATKLKTMTGVHGEFLFPCVPSMVQEYLQTLVGLLKLLGQNLTPEHIENLRQLIEKGISEGFRLSSHARLIVSYQLAEANKGLAAGITINTKVHVESLAEKYQTWPQTRPEPLFGSHPDAKVMAVVSQLGKPENVTVLDVGAGTGRNCLPLAKLGYSVDAIELTPIFAEKLTEAVKAENLPIKVIQGDILDPLLRMRVANYKLAIACEVLSHFRYSDQVRLFLAKMCDCLQSGGLLLFSAFLAADNYQPDNFAREMSDISWCYIITRDELNSAMEDLPLEVISDESVVEYEQNHLPKEAWPPTGWFLSWATGRDLFPIQQNPPMELRWILLKRR
ncbi:class I SAM-dependent methyltransferase [Aerosakkonema funiforme]|uniref:class I SAM-dependent methyltransferase n=1 Tax=Aerosakkonema funiforme TaxID=1246630 RepID=UPI0035BB8B9F